MGSGPSATDLVEYIVIAVPDVDAMAMLVPALADLVEAEAVTILDVIAVEKSDQGQCTVLEIESVASMAGMASVDGEVGGMLSEIDIELASHAVRPGMAAVVLVIEDRWAEGLSEAIRGAGGEISAGERIPRARVEAAMAQRRDVLGQGGSDEAD